MIVIVDVLVPFAETGPLPEIVDVAAHMLCDVALTVVEGADAGENDGLVMLIVLVPELEALNVHVICPEASDAPEHAPTPIARLPPALLEPVIVLPTIAVLA